MKNPNVQQDISFFQRIRMLFNVMRPNETSFQTLEEVPDYIQQVRHYGKNLVLQTCFEEKFKNNNNWGFVLFSFKL